MNFSGGDQWCERFGPLTLLSQLAEILTATHREVKQSAGRHTASGMVYIAAPNKAPASQPEVSLFSIW